MDKKKRVYCFVDGFNLYHAIHDIRPRANYLKWLNLKSLADSFIIRNQEILEEVYYFSAYAKWLPGPYKRHRCYVRALELNGVKPILGEFKEKHRKCYKCNHVSLSHEEKQSDVNIAIHILHHAHLDNYDKAFVITADSDLCPAISLIKQDFPDKEIVILTPPGRYRITREIRASVRAIKIKQKHIAGNLLPEQIPDKGSGNTIIRPKEYAPPE